LAYKSEKNGLMDKIKQLKATVAKMQSDIKEKTAQITKKYNLKVQELENKNKTINSNLSKELEKEKKLIAQKNDLENKIKSLTEELDNKNQNNNELKLQISNLNKELKAKEDEIAQLKEEQEKIIKKAKAKQELLKVFSITNVQFKNNSTELTKESKARLDNTAEKMKEYSNFNYEIQGHTDNRGNEDYNIKLSTKRAEAIKEYLIEKGVPAEILTTKGFGSSQPIADNNTKEGRSKNRRVIFIIHE